MRRIRSVLGAVALAATMLVATGPAQADDGPRACDNWYFVDGGLGYRFSHCASPYFVQDVVKAHARLHLYYRPSPTSGWLDPSSVDSITINGWYLHVNNNSYARAPQSRGSGPPTADFYSAGIGLACNAQAASANTDESVRLANGHAYYGPNDASENVVSPLSRRPC